MILLVVAWRLFSTSQDSIGEASMDERGLWCLRIRDFGIDLREGRGVLSASQPEEGCSSCDGQSVVVAVLA